jgi:hypothetical protein
LREFPAITLSAATVLSLTWRDCTSLVSFSALGQTGNNCVFTETWRGCTGFKEFPLIDTLSAFSLVGSWHLCNSLSSFPILNTKNVTSIYYTWRGCSNLKEFPIIDTSKVTDVREAWRDCSSLSSFPSLNLSGCQDFTGTWSGCTRLTAIPDIDYSNATRLGIATTTGSGIFENCTSLVTVSIPFSATKNVQYFDRMFLECRNLKEFPLIDTSKGLSLHGLCYSATSNSITSFPLLSTPNVTDFRFAWTNSNKLSSFPKLDTSSATRLGFAWEGCSSLSSFPQIDTGNVTDFQSTWRNCYGLSATDFPEIDMSKMSGSTGGQNCFAGVKLTTTSYTSMLTSLCAFNTNSGVRFNGGNSTYNLSGAISRAFLTKPSTNVSGGIASGGRAWTIADGGLSVNSDWINSANLPSNTRWLDITYGSHNSRFVTFALNSNLVAYSDNNGISWTSSTLPLNSNWISIDSGGGSYVITTNTLSNSAAYSTNGSSWTMTAMPSSARWYGVKHGGDRFIAISYGSASSSTTSNIAAYSTNGGQTWTNSILPATVGWYDIEYCSDQDIFVATAFNYNRVAYTDNGGISWQQANLPMTNTYHLAYGNGILVAVSWDSRSYLYSTNGGLTWLQSTNILDIGLVSDVKFGNGSFVAISYNSDITVRSTDGINWSEIKLISGYNWASLAYGNDRFVTVAGTPKVGSAITSNRSAYLIL